MNRANVIETGGAVRNTVPETFSATAEMPMLTMDSLSEVDLMLVRFRLLAQRRAAWLQRLWQEEGEPGGRSVVTHAEITTHLSDSDSPEAEAAWWSIDPQAIVWTAQIEDVTSRLVECTPSRLDRFAQTFNLEPEDVDLLQACLAVALDPSLTRVCAYLQDNAGRPFMTEDLAARLFGYGRCGCWSPQSALFRFELIDVRDTAPGEPRALMCDPLVRDWMLERSGLDESLLGRAMIVNTSFAPLPSWPVAEMTQFLVQALQPGDSAAASGRLPVRLRIDGTRGSGRRTFASILAAQFGLPILVIDVDSIDDGDWRNVFMRAQRQAFLNGCSIAWLGESLTRRSWPAGVGLFPLQFVLCEASQELPRVVNTLERTVTMPALSAIERKMLWRKHASAADSWSEDDISLLAIRHRFQPGEIATAGSAGAASVDETRQLASEASRTKLGTLAQRMDCPFTWDDLVVSPSLRETLADLEFEASHRHTFWDHSEGQRLFPQGRGLLALMSGPPGTGKTMAAQVMAASLGYDLYRVNLATIVSKWVGETTKNIESILNRAAGMDAILLFDEADALFSKRSSEVRDAQDRFANTDTAYLLQAIESYPGIALLTTNQKGSMDPAFQRRLRFVLEFVKPDAAQQELLWSKAIAGLAGDEAFESLAPALGVLSSNIESTGSQIKYAVLGAIFRAERENAKLSANHLLYSLGRELAKEGRALGSRERERILSHVK